MRFALVALSTMSRLVCAILRYFCYAREWMHLGGQNAHSMGIVDFTCVDIW